MVPDLLVVDLDQYNENLYQIINKLILKTENIHIEIYLSTVNPLLSPPGAYFLQALLRWGGLNREGGLKERCGGGGGLFEAKRINGSKVSRGRTCGSRVL